MKLENVDLSQLGRAKKVSVSKVRLQFTCIAARDMESVCSCFCNVKQLVCIPEHVRHFAESDALYGSAGIWKPLGSHPGGVMVACVYSYSVHRRTTRSCWTATEIRRRSSRGVRRFGKP